MAGWRVSARSEPSVPFLNPREQSPLGGGMGDWSAGVMRPSVPGNPADSFDNSSSPVLRYLEKYRRSALSGAPGSLPVSPSGPVGSDMSRADLDISGLPSWMRNALAYQPEDGSASAATDGNASTAPHDQTSIRSLSTFLGY
jgi:hypothetical protein